MKRYLRVPLANGLGVALLIVFASSSLAGATPLGSATARNLPATEPFTWSGLNHAVSQANMPVNRSPIGDSSSLLAAAATVTNTATLTPTSTITPTKTLSATATLTPSATATLTKTPTPTNTTSATVKPGATISSTNTPTPSLTRTSTATLTRTATLTTTATLTRTATLTTTATVTRTATLTTTATVTRTQTITATPTVTATKTLTPTFVVEADIDPALGGELNANNGVVVVKFPPGAASTKLRVRHEPSARDKEQERYPRQVFYRFSLRAFDRANLKQEVTQFKKAISITLRYDPKVLKAWREQDLMLVYWDVNKRRWQPLPSKVDTTRHSVTAETMHFTDFGITVGPDVQGYLPSLESAEPNLFLGSAATEYALEVPPGRNGLAPRLSLSYSSTAVDMMDDYQQASFVGAGWSFTTNYIGRNTRGTYDSADDVFTLILNGAGQDLMRDAASATTYHTASEQYWRIVQDPTNDRWTVTTNDGTQYQYGYSTASRAVQWRVNEVGSKIQETYAWYLEKAIDTHGNEIAYYYRHDTNTTECGVVGASYVYDDGVYPLTIRYNGTVQLGFATEITFTYSARSDYRIYGTKYQCATPQQHSKLDRIDVRTKNESGTLVQVRAYTFTYDYSTFPGVWSGWPSYQYGRLTLKSITRLGSDGTALPPYTLTYSGNRLGKVDNGIGGSTSFTYNPTVLGGGAAQAWRYLGGWDFSGCATWGNCSGAWSATNVSVEMNVLGGNSAMFIWNGGYVSLLGSRFIPGALHRLGMTVYWSDTNPLRITAFDGVSEQLIRDWFSCGNYGNGCDASGTFWVSDSASTLEIRIYYFVQDQKIAIQGANVSAYPTYYRVANRVLVDGQGNSSTFTYAYEGAAINDPTISAAAATCCYRYPAYYQFRGHSKVTVTDPTGGKTENYFKQDDVLLGRLWQVIQSDSNNAKYTRTEHTYTARSIPISAVTTGEQSNFVFVSTTLRETWDAQASPKTTKTNYSYDAYGNLSQTDEFSDATTLYRSTRSTFYLNSATDKWILNKVGLTQVFDGRSNRVSETRYFYDGSANYTTPPTKGDPTRVDVTADGTNFFTSTTNTYDAYGNVLTTTDALNHATRFGYDTTYYIFPTSVTNPLNQTTTNSYDLRLGKLSSTTDPNNATTSYAYDVFGRTTAIWNPLEQGQANPTVRYDYTLGNPRSQVHVQVRKDLGGTNAAAYQHAWWFYDGLARVIQQQTQGVNNSLILVNRDYDSLGRLRRTSNRYDAINNPVSSVTYRAYMPVMIGGAGPATPTPTAPPTPTPVGGTYLAPNWTVPYTEHQYDAIGREIKTINPDTTFQTANYNQWTTTVTDANGHQRVLAADAFGRTVLVLEKNQGQTYQTVYAYDQLNHPKTVTDNASNVTTMNYDWLGRKTSMTDPDMGAWAYGYDSVGNLTQQTDAKSQRTCFYYDGLNRLSGKNYQSNVSACPSPATSYTVAFTYDQGPYGIGRRTGTSDPSGSTTWAYDKQGRLMSQTNLISGAPAPSYTTSWTYDAMNRARSMTYPDGEAVSMTYNDQGLLTTLGGYVTSSSYNAAGQMTAQSLGNNTSTAYSYNAQNLRLTRLQTVAGAPMLDLTYEYDKVGNIKTINDAVRSEISTFTYDDLNRLTSAAITNVYSQGWTYDPLGNITSRTSSVEYNGNQINYTYDPAHKHAVATMGSNSYSYDANGSMTSRAGDTLSYDAENRLQSVTSGGVTTTYTYDGDSNRAKKVVGTAAAFYVGNYFEVTNAGSVTKYYYFGAQRVAMNQGGAVTYLHTDHLGSTNATSGANTTSGVVYFPFGSPRAGNLPTDFTFTGQKFDASDGLMYYGARYYDAALGRFIQADTIVPGAGNPQSLNRYAYVRNNPVKYVDPTGHRACGGPEDLDCDTPSGEGTPGECDLSCVEPPAVTQGEQNPSGGKNPSGGGASVDVRTFQSIKNRPWRFYESDFDCSIAGCVGHARWKTIDYYIIVDVTQVKAPFSREGWTVITITEDQSAKIQVLTTVVVNVATPSRIGDSVVGVTTEKVGPFDLNQVNTISVYRSEADANQAFIGPLNNENICCGDPVGLTVYGFDKYISNPMGQQIGFDLFYIPLR